MPNRGPVVAEITLGEAREIYEMRATLEGLAARLFTRRASDADVAELRNALRELKKAAGKSSDLLLDLKTKYYEVLLTGCGNRIIRRELMQLHNRIRLLRATTLAARTKAAITEISKIIDAIESRDEDGADAASAEHIERAAEWAIGSLQQREVKPAAKIGSRK